MDNDSIRFHARFGGVSREIFVPVNNVMAIYANENGQGMAFETQLGAYQAPEEAEAEAPSLSAVPASEAPAESTPTVAPDGSDEPPKKGGRPTLTRIK